MNAISSLDTCISDLTFLFIQKFAVKMTSTTEEKSMTITASSNNEINGTSSSWAQEVSDTAKGLKNWEITCESNGDISVNLIVITDMRLLQVIAVLLAIGAIVLIYFVIRWARKRRNKDVKPPGLDVSKV